MRGSVIRCTASAGQPGRAQLGVGTVVWNRACLPEFAKTKSNRPFCQTRCRNGFLESRLSPAIRHNKVQSTKRVDLRAWLGVGQNRVLEDAVLADHVAPIAAAPRTLQKRFKDETNGQHSMGIRAGNPPRLTSTPKNGTSHRKPPDSALYWTVPRDANERIKRPRKTRNKGQLCDKNFAEFQLFWSPLKESGSS